MLLLILLALAGCPSDDPDATVPPPSEEPVAELDPAFEEALLEVLSDQRAAHDLPGLAIALRSWEDETWSAVEGSADLSGATELLRGHAFPIGTASELFLTAALSQLESDEFSLHRLPQNQLEGLSNAWGATGRQMLDHTSGLPDYSDHGDFDPAGTAAPSELIALAEALGPAHNPGEFRTYARTNYVYAALVLEALTGRGWDEDLQARFFDPLGLGNSGVVRGADWGLAVEGSSGGAAVEIGSTPAAVDGAANVTASAGNLVTFAFELFDGELLDAQTVFELQATPFNQDGHSYVPGFEVYERDAPDEEWGRPVELPGFGGHVGYREDLGAAIVVLGNADGGWGRSVADAVWGVVEQHVGEPPVGDDDDAVDPPVAVTGQWNLEGVQRHDPAGSPADPSHTGVVVGGWFDFDVDGSTPGRITLRSADFSSGEAVDAVECSFDITGTFDPAFSQHSAVGQVNVDQYEEPSCADWPSASSWQDRIDGNLQGPILVPLSSVDPNWNPAWSGWPDDYGGAKSLMNHIGAWQADHPNAEVGYVALGAVDGLTQASPQIGPWTFLGWLWR